MTNSLPLALQTALGTAYTIERELGGGGMSRVFVAREVALDREVVVKVLAPELAEGLSGERFAREIRLAAALQEPHIVPVLTAGATAEGLPFYTMPFIRGESLRARMEAGRVPAAEATRILRDVAQALAYAHRLGVVHRDIKPENVLLSSGTAVVTDFGIAKALQASKTSAPGGTLTQIGTSLGTPAYMAPEQAAGDEVDHRADLYAWGVVAYEMLSGSHPFASKVTSQQLIAAHIAEPPRPLRDAAPDVPALLGTLVMRCLAKAPYDRPHDATELIAALDTPLFHSRAGMRVLARPAHLAAICAVLLILAGSAFAWRTRQTGSTTDERLVAVFPFRVTGADPSLRYLREGMIDLLAAKLTGDTRVVETRSLLGAWHAAGGNETTDVDASIASRLSARLGAREMLLGDIIASGSRITLHASLVPTAQGSSRDATVEGERDSLSALVDRLAVQLLALRAGRDAHAFDGLAGTPLPAIRDYLEGEALFRRGSYEAARERFNAAVRADSNLAMAWFGLLRVSGWLSTNQDSASHALARLRDRLPAATRAVVDVRVGPNYPVELNVAERRRLAERAVQIAPDNPDAWAAVGEAYFHWASLLGVTDGHARAIGALEHAVGLDSSNSEGLEHLGTLYAERGDSALARRTTEMRLGLDSTSKGALPRLFLAEALGDPHRGTQWRALVRAHPDWLWYVEGEAISLGMSLRVIDSAASANVTRAVTDAERRSQTGNVIFLALLRGQPARAARLRVTTPSDRSAEEGEAQNGMLNAILADGDSALGAESRRTLEGALARDAATALGWFAAGLHDLAHGDAAGGRRSVTKLRAIKPGACDSRVPTLCVDYAMVLDAQLAATERRPDARARLVDVDSMLREGPLRTGPLLQAGNLLAARLWEQNGDQPRALAAVRRRSYFYGPDPSLPVSLREEGRLAGATGDRDGAIRAYRRYLVMRQDAEPSFRAHLDGIRREVARLQRQESK